MSTREFLLDKARSKLGKYAKGSREVLAIWKNAFAPHAMNEAQFVQFARDEEWCGGFVLCCLHESNLIPKEYWTIGSGFVLRVLGRKTTTTPKPGDIGVRSKGWHHFLVEQWNGPNDWFSIDGNTPYCEQKHHTSLDPNITFYSIDSILPAMPEPGFSRDGEYAVPGVQD